MHREAPQLTAVSAETASPANCGAWLQFIATCGWPPPSDMNSRRASPRLAVRLPGRVFFDQPGTRAAESVLVSNVSAGGLELKTSSVIPAGTRILVEISQLVRPVRVLGAVMHCAAAHGEYRVGVRLQLAPVA